MIYADPARRASPAVLRNNRRGQNGLWSYGISGDMPLVLLRISDTEKIELVRQVIKAHSYWRMKGLLIETLLGVNLEGDQLRLTPRMPKSWNTYKIHYRYRQTVYHITITRLDADSKDANQLWLDGEELAAKTVPLVDDLQEHFVEMKVR